MGADGRLRRFARLWRERLASPATIVGCAAFVQAFDISSVAVALPDIACEFGGDPIAYNSVIIAYIIGATAVLPLCGWAVDRFGARRIFLAAVALFGVSAAICGIAGSVTMLLGARVVQGAAGAMLLPVGRVIILASVEEKGFVDAMAALTMPLMLGPVIGPPIAGALITLGSWRLLFLVMLPLAIAGFVLVYRRIAAMPAAHRHPLDIWGSIYLVSALASVAIGVGMINGQGAAWLRAVALIAAGIVLFALYVRHERRHPTALLSLSPMRRPLMRATNIGGIFPRMLTSSTPFLLAILFQQRFGMSAAEAGGIIFALAIGSLAGRAVVAALLRWLGFRTMLLANGIAMALSIAACSLFEPGLPIWIIAPILFVQGLLRSSQLIALSALGYAGMPRSEFSAASTISSLSQQLAQGLGIAISVQSVQLIARIAGEGAMAGAFVVLALVSLLSLGWIVPMARDAGDAMSGRAMSGRTEEDGNGTAA